MLNGITSNVTALGVEPHARKRRHELESRKARERRLTFATPEQRAPDAAACVRRIDEEGSDLGGIDPRVQSRVISLAACITAEERPALAPSTARNDLSRAIEGDEVSLITDQSRVDTERTLQGALDLLATVVVRAERANGASDQIAQHGLISTRRFP